jgi:type II secretory pathway component PulM
VQNVSPRVAQEIIGPSVQLTLNTYSHVLPWMQADTAARMAEVLFAGVTTAETSADNVVHVRRSESGAGGARTHDLTDYESAALTN